VDWSTTFGFGTPVLEIVIRGSVIYLTLFTLLRVLLKREAGEVGITDILVIVLIADAAQNGMADDYKSVTDGVILVAVIVFWAFFLDWLSYHVPAIERLVKPPALKVVDRGRLLRRNMRRELLTESELLSQLREEGIDDVAKVKVACIEPDGRISVVQFDDGEHPMARRHLTH